MTSNLISNNNTPSSPSTKTKALRELMGSESNDEDRTKLTSNFDPHFLNLLQDSRVINNIGSNSISSSNQLPGGNQYQLNTNDIMLIGDLINNNTPSYTLNKKKDDKENGNETIDSNNKKKPSAYFTSVKKIKKKIKPNFQIVQKDNVNNKEGNSSFFNEINLNNLRPTNDIKSINTDDQYRQHDKSYEDINNNSNSKSNDKDRDMVQIKEVNNTEDKDKSSSNTNNSDSKYNNSTINNYNSNNGNNNNSNRNNHHQPNSKSNSSTNATSFKENYLDLLILAADKFFSEGIITYDYLFKSVTESKVKEPLMKCENKLCKAIISNPSEKYDTTMNNSLKVVSLCKECFKAKEAGNYCYYCNIIYREFKGHQKLKDNKGWIQCDYCPRWHHIGCEIQKGVYHNLARLNNPRFKYMCPICRKDNASNYRHPHHTKNNHNLIKQKRKRDDIGDNGESNQKENNSKPNLQSK